MRRSVSLSILGLSLIACGGRISSTSGDAAEGATGTGTTHGAAGSGAAGQPGDHGEGPGPLPAPPPPVPARPGGQSGSETPAQAVTRPEPQCALTISGVFEAQSMTAQGSGLSEGDGAGVVFCSFNDGVYDVQLTATFNGVAKVGLNQTVDASVRRYVQSGEDLPGCPGGPDACPPISVEGQGCTFDVEISDGETLKGRFSCDIDGGASGVAVVTGSMNVKLVPDTLK
jgi:hypothetical protein